MSGPDLKSIPLPSEGEQPRPSQKLSAKEILEKALKEHKSSKKEPVKSDAVVSTKVVKQITNHAEPDPSVKTDDSQRIVDELFKDFISKKMSKPGKSSFGQMETGRTPDKSLTSIDEMSKLLDMEISSIQAHTKDVPEVSQNPTDVNDDGKHKLLTTMNQNSEGESKSSRSSKNPKLKNAAKGDDSSVLKQPSFPSTLKSLSDNIAPAESLTVIKTYSVEEANQITAEKSPSASMDQTSVQPGAYQASNLISNSNSLSKKISGPKQLGCKLSIESLALIQSKDKVDRDGRVWEEGEVPSSHNSDDSDKEEDSESDHDNPSETGSIDSDTGAGGSRHRSSKHKKKHKHKHKHKKKKKKSSKEKEKSRRKSSDGGDNKKEKGKSKDFDGKSDDGGRSSKHYIYDSDKKEHESAKTTEDSVSVSEKEETEVSQKEKSMTRQESSSQSSSKEVEDGKRTEKSKKRKRDKSRSPRRKKSKSSSRSRSTTPKKSKRDSSPKRSSTKIQFSEWDARHYTDNPSKPDRDHSHSPEPKDKEKSSSHKRSRSRDHDRDLRLQIDKAKLRKIAIANALNNLKSGQGPQVDMVTVKAGGKSVEELTDFCKRISEKDRDNEVSDSSDEEPAPKSDDDELPIHHPFKLKETSSNIVMNIRNAKQLPVLTPSEKQAQQAALRLAFPVSSGSHHRATESVWVPVERTTAASSTTTSKPVISQPSHKAPVVEVPKKEEPKVFPEQKETQSIDIGSIISERLQAVRKLQENPYDVQALTSMHKVQEKANQWASSKHLPGQFIGTTGARVLSHEQLIGDKRNQAWAKKVVPTAASNRYCRAKCIPVH